MQRSSRMIALAATCAAIGLAACHSAPPPPPPAPPTPTGPNQDSIRAAQEARDRAAREAADRAAREAQQRAREDSIAQAEAAARAATAAQAQLKATLAEAVHFDYDKSDLRDDTRAQLDAKIPILQANSDVSIRIAGNTDERGSDQYNLALGQRRAGAAKQYLVDHGIAEARITTISYGKERPVAQGSDESAWSQNRRDEFEITAGGQMLKKP